MGRRRNSGGTLVWKGGRAVEGTSLENWQGASPRGFESRPFRQHGYFNATLTLCGRSLVPFARVFRLITWRSQVQVLSPQQNSPAIPITCTPPPSASFEAVLSWKQGGSVARPPRQRTHGRAVVEPVVIPLHGVGTSIMRTALNGLSADNAPSALHAGKSLRRSDPTTSDLSSLRPPPLKLQALRWPPSHSSRMITRSVSAIDPTVAWLHVENRPKLVLSGAARASRLPPQAASDARARAGYARRTPAVRNGPRPPAQRRWRRARI